MMKSGRFGIIFFGMGVTQSLSKNHNIDEAIAVTKDLNEYTKFSIMPMRGHYNVTGSGEVFGWQFGFPYSVDLTRGFARYNPGDTSTIDLLIRGEIDAMFTIGSDPVAHFPISAVKPIANMPSVCVDPHLTPTSGVSNSPCPGRFQRCRVRRQLLSHGQRADRLPQGCRAARGDAHRRAVPH